MQPRPATRSRCRSAGSRSATPTSFAAGDDQGALLLRPPPRGLARRGRRRSTCMDAFCPHLGAHLGHGGTVEGCEHRLPVPRLEVRRRGHQHRDPLQRPDQPQGPHPHLPGASSATGSSLVWYHPDDEPPLWDVPEVPELDSGEFTGPIRTRHVVQRRRRRRWPRTPSTRAHFRYVHNTADGPRDRVATRPTATVADDAVVAEVPDAPRRGRRPHRHRRRTAPACRIVRFSGIVDTLLVTSTTPIDAQTSARSASTSTSANLGDETTTSNVGKAFATEVDKQFLEDTPIWEHKAHLVRPALADTDGPFMKFRKWYSQFYAEAVDADDERTVFPPPLLARQDGRGPGQGHRLRPPRRR